MTISKEIEFDYGHRVPNHKSKCKNLHGHRAKVQVFVNGEVISTKGVSSEGMVIDFSDLKKILMDVIDNEYDHSFIIYKDDPYLDLLSRILFSDPEHRLRIVDFIPTAENLAKHLFLILKPRLEEAAIKIEAVQFWETPTSSAIYKEGN